MLVLIGLGMLVGGVVLAFATKNKRWLILSVLGAAGFLLDLALEVARQMS
jgi:hypothetical protein